MLSESVDWWHEWSDVAGNLEIALSIVPMISYAENLN